MIQKHVPSFKIVDGLDAKKKNGYVEEVFGIYHAAIASFLAIYCFLYADGVEGTTWLHCPYYQTHMFNIQKFVSVFEMGFFIFDLGNAVLTNIGSKFDSL